LGGKKTNRNGWQIEDFKGDKGTCGPEKKMGVRKKPFERVMILSGLLRYKSQAFGVCGGGFGKKEPG